MGGSSRVLPWVEGVAVRCGYPGVDKVWGERVRVCLVSGVWVKGPSEEGTDKG